MNKLQYVYICMYILYIYLCLYIYILYINYNFFIHQWTRLFSYLGFVNNAAMNTGYIYLSELYSVFYILG